MDQSQNQTHRLKHHTEKPDNFKFKGFLPNKTLQQRGKAIYSLVEDHSPSEAAKKASLTKIGDSYEARLKIVSASCSFEVFSKQAAPLESMDSLYKKFTSKILKWTKERENLCFSDELAEPIETKNS